MSWHCPRCEKPTLPPAVQPNSVRFCTGCALNFPPGKAIQSEETMQPRDPFTIMRPARGTVMIAFRGAPILACDEGPTALALCALLNSGYGMGKR